MSPEYVIKLGQETLYLVLLVAGPMLIVALVVGFGVGIDINNMMRNLEIEDDTRIVLCGPSEKCFLFPFD